MLSDFDYVVFEKCFSLITLGQKKVKSENGAKRVQTILCFEQKNRLQKQMCRCRRNKHSSVNDNLYLREHRQETHNCTKLPKAP